MAARLLLRLFLLGLLVAGAGAGDPPAAAAGMRRLLISGPCGTSCKAPFTNLSALASSTPLWLTLNFSSGSASSASANTANVAYSICALLAATAFPCNYRNMVVAYGGYGYAGAGTTALENLFAATLFDAAPARAANFTTLLSSAAQRNASALQTLLNTPNVGGITSVTGVGLFGGTCTTGPCVYSLTCSAHSHEGAGVSLTQHALSAAYAGRRRALLAGEQAAPALPAMGAGRRLQACGTACLAPKYVAGSFNASMVMEVTFSSAYAAYADSNGAPMAYGICSLVGCNYRNVAVTYLTGNVVTKQDFLFSVTFWSNSSALSASYISSLTAAVPATLPGNVTACMTASSGAIFGIPSCLLFYMNSGLYGGLAVVSGIYAGYGSFAPPSAAAHHLLYLRA